MLTRNARNCVFWHQAVGRAIEHFKRLESVHLTVELDLVDFVVLVGLVVSQSVDLSIMILEVNSVPK